MRHTPPNMKPYSFCSKLKNKSAHRMAFWGTIWFIHSTEFCKLSLTWFPFSSSPPLTAANQSHKVPGQTISSVGNSESGKDMPKFWLQKPRWKNKVLPELKTIKDHDGGLVSEATGKSKVHKTTWQEFMRKKYYSPVLSFSCLPCYSVTLSSFLLFSEMFFISFHLFSSFCSPPVLLLHFYFSSSFCPFFTLVHSLAES